MGAVIALAAVGLVASGAKAESTCLNVFDVCGDLTAVESGGVWRVSMEYVAWGSRPLGFGRHSFLGGGEAEGVGIGSDIRQLAHGHGRLLHQPERPRVGFPGASPGAGETRGAVGGGFTPGEGVTFTPGGFAARGAAGHAEGSATGCTGEDCSPSAATTTPASTTTPEPASMVLLAAGLAGMGLMTIRRQRRKRVEA